jgi:uncharacterized protein (DUF4415 family)
MSKIDPIEERLKLLPEPDLDDPDNPEWTEEDFARARPASELPPEVLAAFPNTKVRGRPKSERPKIGAYLRLDADVLDFFKAGGPGWQTRINAELRRAIKG